jgi:hypothetical protein
LPVVTLLLWRAINSKMSVLASLLLLPLLCLLLLPLLPSCPAS